MIMFVWKWRDYYNTDIVIINFTSFIRLVELLPNFRLDILVSYYYCSIPAII